MSLPPGLTRSTSAALAIWLPGCATKNAGKVRDVPPIDSQIVVRGDAATAYSHAERRRRVATDVNQTDDQRRDATTCAIWMM